MCTNKTRVEFTELVEIAISLVSHRQCTARETVFRNHQIALLYNIAHDASHIL